MKKLLLLASLLFSLTCFASSSLTAQGGFPVVLNATGNTNIILPTSGTLVTTTGTGASGTWSINITGNAATVTTNANLTGDVTSSGNATSYNNLVPLNKGGLNANLTASNGGIFYSTSTAGAILAGTATAGKVLQSGSSALPYLSLPDFYFYAMQSSLERKYDNASLSVRFSLFQLILHSVQNKDQMPSLIILKLQAG